MSPDGRDRVSPSSTIKVRLCWAHAQTSKQTGVRERDMAGGSQADTWGSGRACWNAQSAAAVRRLVPCPLSCSEQPRSSSERPGRIQVGSPTHKIQVAACAAQVLSTSHQQRGSDSLRQDVVLNQPGGIRVPSTFAGSLIWACEQFFLQITKPASSSYRAQAWASKDKSN